MKKVTFPTQVEELYGEIVPESEVKGRKLFHNVLKVLIEARLKARDTFVPHTEIAERLDASYSGIVGTKTNILGRLLRNSPYCIRQRRLAGIQLYRKDKKK